MARDYLDVKDARTERLRMAEHQLKKGIREIKRARRELRRAINS